MGNRETTPRRRSSSKEIDPPNMSGDSSRENSEQEETERREEQERLRREEEERLKREEEERLKRQIESVELILERELNCFQVIYTAPDDELDGVIMAERSIFMSCSILHYSPWKEEEERLRKEEERLKEVNAATIGFFLEFDWVFKEENPLITGHLTGIAVELDKVIMKATMAKRSFSMSCEPECDRYLERLRTAKEELLSMRRLDRLRKNYWGLFGFFQREEEEEEKLREVIELTRDLKRCLEIYTAPDDELDRVIMAKRREVIEETNKFYKESDGWFKEENPLIAGHLATFADKLDKVIMKAIVAKGSIVSSCLSECDRYLERLRTAKEEILRRQERLMENIRGLFGFFQREEEEKLSEVIEETIRFFKESDGWFKEENPLIAGHLAAFADKLDKVIMKDTMAKQSEVIEETNKFYKESDWWFKEENPLIAGHLAGFADKLDKVIMKDTMAKQREVIEETNKFYKEFEGWFKEENPLIAGHLAGFADKLDKVIMKDTMAKQREVIEETIRFLKESDWWFKEENPLIAGHLAGFADKLDKVIMKDTMAKQREVIEETIRFFKESDGWFKEENPLIAGHLAGIADKLDKVIMKAIVAKQRLKLLYEQERYKMTPILLSAPKRVSREDFSIPSFVQLRRQANLSRSTPHSHDLGGADTGEALLPPVLVSTLKDALADLSLVGGGSLDETIRRILQAVLKDEVASELYWAGHGSKQSFQQANLQEVIFRASGKRYSGEAAFADVGPHQHQLQLQHQQCMLVKAF